MAYVHIERSGTCIAIYPEPASCATAREQQTLLMDRFWPVTILCLLVALFLQIAVNYANDYSDGIRGTDAGRDTDESKSGKTQRLTASGLVPAKHVLFGGDDLRRHRLHMRQLPLSRDFPSGGCLPWVWPPCWPLVLHRWQASVWIRQAGRSRRVPVLRLGCGIGHRIRAVRHGWTSADYWALWRLACSPPDQLMVNNIRDIDEDREHG